MPAQLSFTGLVYIPVTLAFVILSYQYFKNWRDQRTTFSSQLFILFVLLTLICLSGALAGTVYLNSPTGLAQTLIISSFFVALLNALLGYIFIQEQFPDLSPWFGFIPILIYGLYVSILTTTVEISPALEENGGLDWGLPVKIDYLRSIIYLLGFAPITFVFIRKYIRHSDYRKKREYLFLSIVSIFTLGIVIVDFIIEPALSAPALWSELAILILFVVALILYLILNEQILKVSENRLKLIVDAAQLGLWDYYLNSGKVVINDTWKSHSNLSLKQPFTTFSSIVKLLHPDDQNIYTQKIQDHIEGKTDVFSCESRTRQKDGTYCWVQDTGKIMVRDQNGKPERLLGVRMDINEKKNYETKIQKALSKADESNRLKSEFLTLLSHEIRTPMNGILGFADLLADPNFESAERDLFLKSIRESGDRMLKTITDIVVMAKIKTGELGLNIESIWPLKILNEQISLWQAHAREKGLQIQIFYPEKINYSVIKNDKEKLELCFNNLINNAIKYTSEGTIKIYYYEHPDSVEFRFTDTGIGIPENKRKTIFQEFIQARQDHSKPFEGLGLGLSITKALSIKMGGSLDLDTKYNQGSSFILNISSHLEDQVSVSTNTH